jgi:hypothetical protein
MKDSAVIILVVSSGRTLSHLGSFTDISNIVLCLWLWGVAGIISVTSGSFRVAGDPFSYTRTSGSSGEMLTLFLMEDLSLGPPEDLGVVDERIFGGAILMEDSGVKSSDSSGSKTSCLDGVSALLGLVTVVAESLQLSW